MKISLVTLFLLLPNSLVTPGSTIPGVTAEQICVPGYTQTVRNVSKYKKKQVFNQYMVDPKSDRFEIDHLISLELGGANDIKNLWPQSYTSEPYNAYDKDRLENKLHKMVCDKEIDLQTAQKLISIDWIAAYNRYVGDK